MVIRWGIIGPGRIAHKFAQDLKHVEGAVLTAVASRDKGRAETFANEYGAKYAYGSYDEIVSCPELDVVYIASPHVFHFEHTLLCLSANIPVLCEKPFAMNKLQVETMVDSSRIRNTFLMEAFWTRFLPWTHKMLEIIESGAIGKVMGLKADFGFRANQDLTQRAYNKDLGGGALLDIGIYPVFLAYLVFGMPYEIASHCTFAETKVDESTGMTLTYRDGTFAFLSCTFRAETTSDAVIYGEKGMIFIEPRWHESKAFTVKYQDGTTERFTFDRPTWGYQYEIEEVNTCLREGRKESDWWTLRDSLNLIQILDAVRNTMELVYEDHDDVPTRPFKG
ncbi:MAG: Gfo/Idh/MocA family oxidoreductase [Bacteroidetes bacterium]|nr:Gfo/Idh/MocA family oxidoreductase [Bacteroidota bacterium]